MPITEFHSNIGGLNITDSPLSLKDSQATGQSYNYDYSKTGAISKILAPLVVNSLADSQLKSLGLAIHHSVSTDARTVVRCAGTSIQTVNVDAGSFTTLTDDTVSASTTFLDSSSTQPVIAKPFNTSAGTQLWLAGGGMSNINAYTGTNITANGTSAPTGTLSATLGSSGTGGTWSSTGTRFYAIAFRKRGTQALSNAALDVSVNVDDTTKKVVVSTASVTIDTTKYDKVYIYRSAVSGVTAFTTGDLIAQLDSTTTTFDDTGSYITTASVVPRAGNTTDNSVLATGTYKYLQTFKRRLITSKESTIYLSDLNKPESWPIANTVTIPTGGPITGLAVIGYNSPFTTGADEYLVIFKETETWVLTGNDLDDWELKYVDQVGCIGQSYVVNLNGFIAWMDYRGIYLWDGHGKPVYCSRPIEALFASDGDLDKTKLGYGFGVYYQKSNQLIWRVSHRTKGEQKLSIKLDTRLTLPQADQGFDKRILDGVFILDTDSTSTYSGLSYRPTNYDEQLLVGDDTGYVYKMFQSASTATTFGYETKPLDMNQTPVIKRFNRVLVWVERLTDHDLTLNYWADYRNRSEDKSSVKSNMKPSQAQSPALWDVATWDQSYWDDYQPDISVLEFHIHNQEGNGEGQTIKLQFEQTEANAPVRIHGFAVDWEPITTANKGAA
jgi:hypothetical protein